MVSYSGTAGLAEGSPEHIVFWNRRVRLLVSLLWRGVVVLSVGAGCGLCGGVLEKFGRKTRVETMLLQETKLNQRCKKQENYKEVILTENRYDVVVI